MSTHYACHYAETVCKELLTFQDVIKHEENSIYSTVLVCVLGKDMERHPKTYLTIQGR